jgi:hypothetical protein
LSICLKVISVAFVENYFRSESKCGNFLMATICVFFARPALTRTKPTGLSTLLILPSKEIIKLIESAISKEDDIWEAIQLIGGETFIYHKGFREEANVKDVFKFSAGFTQAGQVTYQFSRFDFNPLKPVKNSSIRLNHAVITFTWYIDPNSDVIRDLKRAMLEMDANKAGLVLPGQKG